MGSTVRALPLHQPGTQVSQATLGWGGCPARRVGGGEQAPNVSAMSLWTPRERVLRQPDLRGLVVPRQTGQTLTADEVDYDDLVMHRAWRTYEPNRPAEVRYFMYQLSQRDVDSEAYQGFYKAVRFLRVTRVPRYLRQLDAGSGAVYSQQRKLLTGLREQQVLFINMIAKSPKLPLVFAYGVQAVGASVEEAQAECDRSYAVLQYLVEGVYQQLQYAPITAEEAELLVRYQQQWRHIAVARGRPNPLGATGGVDSYLDGNRTDPESSMGMLDGFIRGMGDKSFMMNLITVPIAPGQISGVWNNLARKLSDVRSEQSGSRGVSAGFALPLAMGSGLTDTHGASHQAGHSSGTGDSHTTSHSDTVGVSHGTTHTDSTSVSQSQGTSEGLSQSHSLSQGDSVTQGLSESHGTSASSNVGQGVTHGSGTTQGVGVSHGEGISQGTGTSQGVSSSQSLGQSASQGNSWSSSVSNSLSAAQSRSDSIMNSFSKSVSQNFSLNHGLSDSASRGLSSQTGTSTGNNGSFGVPELFGGGASMGANQSQGQSATQGVGSSHGLGTGLTTGGSQGQSAGSSLGSTMSQGYGMSSSAGGNTTSGISATNSVGQSLTQSAQLTQSSQLTQSQQLSQSDQLSVAQSMGRAVGVNDGVGINANMGHNTGQSAGVTQSMGSNTSVSASQGQSVAQSATQSASASDGVSQAVSAQSAYSNAYVSALSKAASQSTSIGVVPNLGIMMSRNTYDEGKRVVGDLIEAQMNRYIEGIEAGAFMYQLFLVCEDELTLTGASGLLKSSFWGPGDNGKLPQPFHVTDRFEGDERDRLLAHAAAFTSYRRREPSMELVEPYLYSTYLTPSEGAAMTQPPTTEGLGLLAVHDSMPVFAMPYDRADRDIYLGHIINGERGIVSNQGYGLDLDELVHTLVAGTTGSGKTTLLRRMILEAVQSSKEVVDVDVASGSAARRQVPAGALVLDWARSFRGLAALVPQDRFAFYSISKPELGRFRYNPLALPDDGMNPVEWANNLSDLFMVAFGLGEVARSIFYEKLAELYSANRLEPYVLRPEVVDEDGIIRRAAIELPAVDPSTLPAGAVVADPSGLAVANVYSCPALSRLVSLEHIGVLVAAAIEHQATREGKALGGNNMQDRLQTVWRRIMAFAPGGALSGLFAADERLDEPRALRVQDLVDPARGLVTVVEADGLDLANRKFVLGAVLQSVYRYGVHNGEGVFDQGGKGPGTFIVMEEAHELFGSQGDGEDRDAAATRVAIYESMFRRARAYGLKLVAAVQNPADVPNAILGNVGCVVSHQVVTEADKRVVGSLFNWISSPVGGQIRELRYLGEQPIGHCILRLKAREHFLEAAPVHIAVDPPDFPRIDDAYLVRLAAARGRSGQ